MAFPFKPKFSTNLNEKNKFIETKEQFFYEFEDAYTQFIVIYKLIDENNPEESYEKVKSHLKIKPLKTFDDYLLSKKNKILSPGIKDEYQKYINSYNKFVAHMNEVEDTLNIHDFLEIIESAESIKNAPKRAYEKEMKLDSRPLPDFNKPLIENTDEFYIALMDFANDLNTIYSWDNIKEIRYKSFEDYLEKTGHSINDPLKKSPIVKFFIKKMNRFLNKIAKTESETQLEEIKKEIRQTINQESNQ